MFVSFEIASCSVQISILVSIILFVLVSRIFVKIGLFSVVAIVALLVTVSLVVFVVLSFVRTALVRMVAMVVGRIVSQTFFISSLGVPVVLVIRAVLFVIAAIVFLVVEIGVLFVLVLVVNVMKAARFVAFLVVLDLSVIFALRAFFFGSVLGIMRRGFTVSFFVSAFVVVVPYNANNFSIS